MNAMLYMPGKDDPIAVLDHVDVVTMNDNHTLSPERVFFRTRRLGNTKKMIELVRDEKLVLKLADGRSGSVLLQHTSLDSKGQSVGVLRVVGSLNPDQTAQPKSTQRSEESQEA
jgi:hypothetical protein